MSADALSDLDKQDELDDRHDDEAKEKASHVRYEFLSDFGAIYLAHAAFANLGGDGIRAQGGAGGVRH